MAVGAGVKPAPSGLTGFNTRSGMMALTVMQQALRKTDLNLWHLALAVPHCAWWP